jgi:hypothetical protein
MGEGVGIDHACAQLGQNPRHFAFAGSHAAGEADDGLSKATGYTVWRVFQRWSPFDVKRPPDQFLAGLYEKTATADPIQP